MAHRPAQHLLIEAVNLEDLALVEMLLSKGARPNVQSSPGDSPLALATMQGGATMVSMLLSHGADPKLKHSGGKTPLMLAAKRGFLELVLMLLQHPEGRRTVEHRDRVGRTALWLACRRGHTDVALELLLQGGARHQIWDKEGETPLRAAIKSGVRDCIYLLEVSPGIMYYGSSRAHCLPYHTRYLERSFDAVLHEPDYVCVLSCPTARRADWPLPPAQVSSGVRRLRCWRARPSPLWWPLGDGSPSSPARDQRARHGFSGESGGQEEGKRGGAGG